MAAVDVSLPVSVPTSLGAREVLDLGSARLDLQKVENPQSSIHQCATRYGPQTIRSIFEKLAERGLTSKFEELNLADNNIGDEGARYLAEGLRGNPHLRQLVMPRTRVGTQGMKAIGGLLEDAPKLENLIVSSNICDAAGVQGEFCEGLLKNKALKSLVIAACRIGNDGLAALCDGPVQKHPVLEHLCLTYNRLEGATAAKAINKALAQSMSLRHLDLCGNSLGPEGAILLVQGLKENKGRVRQLSLAQNCLKLQGARALTEHFSAPEGASLIYLDLRHNFVGYRGVVELRKALGKPLDGPGNEGWMMTFGEEHRQLMLDAH